MSTGPAVRAVASETHEPLDAPARWNEPSIWQFGYLFSQALTIGGGTGDVQRNILAERVLGLPHDVDADTGRSWRDGMRSRA